MKQEMEEDNDIGRRKYDDANWCGYIQAQVENHDNQINKIYDRLEIKNTKIENLKGSDIALHGQLEELNHRIETSDLTNEKRWEELITLIRKIHIWQGLASGIIIMGGFSFFILEKFPGFVKLFL